ASERHVVVAPNWEMLALGASVVIAGVLGVYLVLFPRQGVRVFQFGMIMEVPALIVIGLWGLLQFWNGFGSLGRSGEGGGVAFMAHVGGFVAGILLVFLFRNPPEPRGYRRDPDYW